MKRKQLKQHVISVLRKNNLHDARDELSTCGRKELINALIPLLCHTEEYVKWQCVYVLGGIIHDLSEENLEAGRVVMRRFLWMLNDESGGIGWGVPEAMSEAMYMNSRLASEYLHMVVSYVQDDGPELFQDGNFLELPLLQQGVLWGLCRLSLRYPSELIDKGVADNLGVYFVSEDSQVRGMVCRLCGLLLLPEFIPQLRRLQEDKAVVKLYLEDGVSRQSVGALAKQGLKRLLENQPSLKTPDGRSR